MNREQFIKVMDLLPGADRGLYFKGLNQVANGKISIRKNIIKVPIEIPLDQLGSKRDDLCAALMPDAANNDLVPLLVFIEPKLFLETMQPQATPGADAIKALERIAAYPKTKADELSAEQMRAIARAALPGKKEDEISGGLQSLNRVTP